MCLKALTMLVAFFAVISTSCLKDRVEDTANPPRLATRTPSTKITVDDLCRGSTAANKNPKNALTELAGNKFNSYQISPRVDIPIGIKANGNVAPATKQ
jgi:hypothetical protein